MTVRVRGIYATALTETLEGVVQASPAIAERFDADFQTAPAAASVDTTADRQGVIVTGAPDRVTDVEERLQGVGLDALAWRADAPVGAIFDGRVVETLGSGAVVDLGDGEGFLPFDNSDDYLEEGDAVRVQVTEARPPWRDGRPVVDTDLAVRGDLATLVRGEGSGDGGPSAGGPELADVVPADPPAGWRVRWERDGEDASFEALGEAVEAASETAGDIDAALADAPDPTATAPSPVWTDRATACVWFGRETRFALDERRRAVVPTMAGHHRIKAGTEAASAAVDLVEAVCGGGAGAGGETADGGAEADGGGTAAAAAADEGPGFPFDAVTRQFGPREGDRVGIGHGKPDGRRIVLGRGEVTERDADGTLVVEREMSPGGSYDALGVQRRQGDVAVTKFKEGRWWYPTVYRGDDGERRGTYVNICTPVEVFPDEVRYVDLHVDVVKHADGTVERVDDDELDEAVEAGEIPENLAKKARAVATAVERAF